MIQTTTDTPENEQTPEESAKMSSLQEQLQRDTRMLDKLDKLSEIIGTLRGERSQYRVMLDMDAQLPTEPCNSPLALAILVGIGLFGLTCVGGCVWKKLR